jgi:drug/metabolite transporter (DMT)-like permease
MCARVYATRLPFCAVRRPDRVVLAVFAATVLVGSSNFVAVRFSNRELEPLWGAAIRIGAAGVLLLALALATRVPLPRGRALGMALGFGVWNFGVGYALTYLGLVDAPAAFAASVVATVPLLTLFMAAAVGLERITLRRLGGAVVAIGGVAIIFADQLRLAVPLATIAAVVGLALVIASSNVIAKRMPGAHPIATNAVAMPIGALLLFALTAATAEHVAAPTRPEVWSAVVYLVFSTIVLFVGFFFVVRRWTASATAYSTVLTPIVAVTLGAALAGEAVSLQFVAGAALVIAGTYVGALAASL